MCELVRERLGKVLKKLSENYVFGENTPFTPYGTPTRPVPGCGSRLPLPQHCLSVSPAPSLSVSYHAQRCLRSPQSSPESRRGTREGPET